MNYKIHYIEQSGPPARVLYAGVWYYATGRRAQGGTEESNFAIWEFQQDTNTAVMNWSLPGFVWASIDGKIIDANQ